MGRFRTLIPGEYDDGAFDAIRWDAYISRNDASDRNLCLIVHSGGSMP